MSLTQLVAEEVKRPLSYEMLRTMLPNWCRFATYDSLAKFKTLKDALQGKQMLVVLYQVHDKKTKKLVNMPGHYIVLNTRAKNQPVEYFSSSGWTPSAELAATHSDRNIFARLLGRNFIHNSVAFENVGDMNTCWRWVLTRCVLGHVSLKEFQRLFNQKFMPKDSNDIVTLMTLLLTIQKDIKK